MQSPIDAIRDPTVSLHDLVNKLAVIVGHCDLLGDHLKVGPPSTKHVSAIREIAQGMVTELAGVPTPSSVGASLTMLRGKTG